MISFIDFFDTMMYKRNEIAGVFNRYYNAWSKLGVLQAGTDTESKLIHVIDFRWLIFILNRRNAKTERNSNLCYHNSALLRLCGKNKK